MLVLVIAVDKKNDAHSAIGEAEENFFSELSIDGKGPATHYWACWAGAKSAEKINYTSKVEGLEKSGHIQVFIDTDPEDVLEQMGLKRITLEI